MPERMIERWDIESITSFCQKINGIDLSQGVSSLPLDKQILEGFYNILADQNVHRYSSSKGIVELRESIASKFYQFNQIAVDPETEVIITHGATGALSCAIKVLFHPGDEVLLFEPFYPAHRNLLELFGIKVRLMPLNLDDLSFDLEQLEQSINCHTRGILLCNPSNPLGKVFKKEELQALGKIAEKYNLYVVSDEIYEYMTYDSNRHISFAALDNNKLRTITVSGISKTYNVTGWRLGYAAGPSHIIKKMAITQDLLYVCPVTPFQNAAIGLMSLPDSYYHNLKQFYQMQRDIVISDFINVGFKPIVPEGSYYALVDISNCFSNDEIASEQLILKTKVATIPARIFFTSVIGQKYIRICFAKCVPTLSEALGVLPRGEGGGKQ